jgi:ring-1,2-phenylacetyl-CoA epoxidase subunit PaaE
MRSRTHAAEDAVCLTFSIPEALREAYRFEAGQHLAVRAVVGGRELRRTYSIASPVAGDLRIGVRVQGEMSRYLAQEFGIGERLDVMTPNGRFRPSLEPERAKSYLAVAAGSGITPVLSIASTVLEAEPESRFMLVFGNRSAARTMFLEDVLALKNRYLARFAVHFVMSREPQDVELFNGRIDGTKLRTLAATVFDPAGIDEYFLCGPGAMLKELTDTLRELGATARIHVERFTAPAAEVRTAYAAGAEGATRPMAPRTEDAAGSADITITMDGRRRAFRMRPDGQSILEAAEYAGLELPFSCRAGVCSTCRARVLAGTVAMERNQALEDWELDAGFVLCCQARPTSSNVEISYDER